MDKSIALKIWNKLACHKVNFIAWRVIRNRLPVREELKKRCCIPLNSNLYYPLCKQGVENISHLFFTCEYSYALWSDIIKWMGVFGPMPADAIEHLMSFEDYLEGGFGRVVAVGIWECTVWKIWSTRNDIVFGNGMWNTKKILGEVKSYVWNWVVTKKKEKIKCLKSGE
ncbi:hypothetical protein OROGR_030909 [Orobanche gracilis]